MMLQFLLDKFTPPPKDVDENRRIVQLFFFFSVDLFYLLRRNRVYRIQRFIFLPGNVGKTSSLSRNVLHHCITTIVERRHPYYCVLFTKYYFDLSTTWTKQNCCVTVHTSIIHGALIYDTLLTGGDNYRAHVSRAVYKKKPIVEVITDFGTSVLCFEYRSDNR